MASNVKRCRSCESKNKVLSGASSRARQQRHISSVASRLTALQVRPKCGILDPPLQHRQHSSRIAVDYRPSRYSTLPLQISVLLEANAWQINQTVLVQSTNSALCHSNTAITISACVSRHFAELPGMNKSGRVIRYLLGSLSPTKQAAHSQGQHCARDCQRESELPTRNGNAQKSAQNNNCFHKLRKIDLPQARCPFHSVKELLLKMWFGNCATLDLACQPTKLCCQPSQCPSLCSAASKVWSLGSNLVFSSHGAGCSGESPSFSLLFAVRTIRLPSNLLNLLENRESSVHL